MINCLDLHTSLSLSLMTDNNHPITPPPELVQQWVNDFAPKGMMAIATQAARWGADQELEACCEWLETYVQRWAEWSADFRADRRPKPPSLKELNLKHLEVMERDGHYLPEIIADLRRAIESLPS